MDFSSKTTNISAFRNIDYKKNIEDICNRIDKLEPTIAALLPEEKRLERLLHQFHDLENKYPVAGNRPPLFGIPVAIKDIIRVNGFQTLCGSSLPASLFAGAEASVVTKLKNFGALILGKSVTTEFAYLEPANTRNPANTDYSPGGSSSGSAASVAAGYTPFALGTQTIGSTIRPASYCGIIGFKPSYNRIPKDGIVPFSDSADHVGLFTQTVDDAEFIASLLISDWNNFVDDFPEKFSVGVPLGKYMEQASKEVLDNFAQFVGELKQIGIEVKEIDVFDDITDINKIHLKLCAAEMAIAHKDWYAEHAASYRPLTSEMIKVGKKVNTDDLNKSRTIQQRFRSKVEIQKMRNNIHLWLTPSATTTAPQGISSTGSPLMNLPWTFAGLPVITIPNGKNENNLPLGIQFTGSFGKDEVLFQYIKKILSLLNRL